MFRVNLGIGGKSRTSPSFNPVCTSAPASSRTSAKPLRARLNEGQHGPAIEAKRNLGLMGGVGDIDHVPLRADEAETGMALFVGISEKTQS